MAAPKNKYISLFDGDSEPVDLTLQMAGIVSNQKAYRLVWQLNQLTGMELTRSDDLFYTTSKTGDIYIQCFEYTNEEYGYTFRLVGNKTSTNILIPSHRNTDYFLLAKGELEANHWTGLIDVLKKLTFAQAVYTIDFNTIKNKDILYY